MPKIEVNENIFYKYIGQKLSQEQLVNVLEVAKAELDEYCQDEGTLKIELNDTNRPDLWSTAGLARQLKYFLGGKRDNYNFFSTKGDNKQTEDKVVKVDKNLKNIRPYICAFIAQGPPLKEYHLIDIIQSQEKLCDNYGRKRKAIAMGIYRSDIIEFPIHYIAADPQNTRFVPLGLEKELNLDEILSEHPKGIEFGEIVKDFNCYPFLEDNKGGVLSFPPIINSDRIGAVEVGDSELFIEMTGTDMNTLLLATSITACDFYDMGYKIKPVRISYPYDTPYGREVVTPYFFQKQISLKIDYACKLLGEEISITEAVQAVEKMGSKVKTDKDTLILNPPAYRNDFLHAVDVIEEIMMGRGLNSFNPILPEDFTVGRLSGEEEFIRKARDIMVGLGFQEMIYNYLGSKLDIIEKMNIKDDEIIEIANPMTESYEIVRNSILPNLLNSETISANAVYPHQIFEVGRIAKKDNKENYGTKTSNYLSFLYAASEADFNDVSSHVSAIFFYLSKEYKLKEIDDPRFINGRSAQIIYKTKPIGIFGEIHPQILGNWGIQTPCTAAEIDLDEIMK